MSSIDDSSEIIKLHSNKKTNIPWTQKYKPIKVILSLNKDNINIDSITYVYMKKFGIDNVRSINYKDIELNILLEKELQSINYIEKYGSLNYYPNSIKIIEDYLYMFFNNEVYKTTTLDGKYTLLTDEIKSLENILPTIHKLRKLIRDSETLYHDDIHYHIKTFPENYELMNRIFEYDDRHIYRIYNIYDDNDFYNRMIRTLSYKTDSYNFTSRRLSSFVYYIIDYNIKKNNELKEILDINGTETIISFKILGLFEERNNILHKLEETKLNSPILNSPPPYCEKL